MWCELAKPIGFFSLGESCRRYERIPDTACMGFYSISMAIIGHDGNPPFNDSSLGSSIQLLLDCKSPYFTVVADSITSVLVLPLSVAKSRSFWLNHYVWLNFSWVHTPQRGQYQPPGELQPPSWPRHGNGLASRVRCQLWRYHGHVMGIYPLVLTNSSPWKITTFNR